jgi:hypothetical protein
MNSLGQETGGDSDSRVTEAQRLVDIITASADELTPREREFVMQMDGCKTCSGKQLFWLRDIKDKYL